MYLPEKYISMYFSFKSPALLHLTIEYNTEELLAYHGIKRPKNTVQRRKAIFIAIISTIYKLRVVPVLNVRFNYASGSVTTIVKRN